MNKDPLLNPAPRGARILQIASSFTSTPIARALRALVVDAGVADDISFVQYAQVTEYMLGPAADSAHILGTIVLVRVEDWLRDELKSSSSASVPDLVQRVRQRLVAHVDEFVKQITSLAHRGKPVWLLACPSSGWVSESYKLAPLCRTYTNLLLARLRNMSNITVLNWPSSLAGAEVNDRNTDRLGQIPFTLAAFEDLSRFLGSQIETVLATRAASASAAPSNGNANLANGSSDLADFLSGLGVRVRLAAPEAGDRTHVDRILRTAAAFSLTGEKRDLSDSEVDHLLQSDGCLLINVSDRLSNYGPSGVVSFRAESDSLDIEALALSCPVLGKQVEYAVISALARIAAERRCRKVSFEYQPSGRNQIMSTFLKSVSEEESQTRYVLPVAEAEERIAKAAVAPGTWTLDFGTYSVQPVEGNVK